MTANNFSQYSILYAEDDNEMRKNYANHFQTLFKNVYTAKDGLEAYKLYKQHLPDILLLDISMPNIDGLTLAKKIREDDEVVKIIVLTAHGDQEKLLNAIKLNLVDYLLKPIKRATLILALENAVSSYINIDKINRPISLSNQYIWYNKSMELYNKDEKIHLTNKERLLLSLLCSNNHYFSVEMIIEHFYIHLDGIEMSLEAVRGVIKRLKTKLPKNILVNEFGIGYKINVN